jgi:membrane protein DedA with SNARE-associated domain
LNTVGAAIDGLAAIEIGWFTNIISLIALPFAHEDLAIVLGGYIVVNKLMPLGLVVACIYLGMVVSDFALYGVGFGARRLPWLRQFAVDGNIHRFSDVLKRNVFAIVTLCRFVPGVVFVAFIACGWTRVPFSRFVAASIVVSAFYLPLMLYLVIMFGDALDDHAGAWTWPIVFGALAAAGLLRQRVLAMREAITAPAAVSPQAAPTPLLREGFAGLPALPASGRRLAAAERIPPLLFYLPMVLNWIALGLRYRSLTLPTCANPAIPTGGMWGESKSDILLDVSGDARRFVAAFITVRRRPDPSALSYDVANALTLLEQHGLDFPIIAKPDIGWHGYGVRLIANADALADYLAHYPPGEQVILQRYVPHACEAAVLYARLPGEPSGRVLSLALRYFPHVVGDGRSTVRALIGRDVRTRWKAALHLGDDASHRGPDGAALDRVPGAGEIVRIALIGNQRAGALYRDGRAFVTRALDQRIDQIARSMTEFHYGRFDLRFESLEQLGRGEDFSIVEINGIGGEAICAWDPELKIREVYRRFVDQQRILFMIGGLNRARGFVPETAREFLGALVRQTDLIGRYPPSS